MRIRLPRRPSRNSLFGQFCNEVVDVLERIIPQSVDDAKVSRTTRGTFINPEGGHGGGTAAAQRFPSQWVDRDYAADDLVICETKDELDDGKQAGTYFAPVAIKKGDPRPGAPGSKWKDFSLGRWEQITFRVGNSRVRINAGRDGTVGFIDLKKDITGVDPTQILLDLQDILTFLGFFQHAFGANQITGQCRFLARIGGGKF